MNLAHRSLRSSAYTIFASGVQTAVLFVRSIILARLLTPEIFGVYAYATSFIILTNPIPRFGLSSAFLHRAPESEGETAARVHFTIMAAFALVWMLALDGIGALILTGETLLVLWVVTATQFLDNLTTTAETILIKKVAFRRIALLNLVSTLATSVGAVWLAWRGYGVWSLVATDIIAAFVVLSGFYLIRPVWRPRLGWSMPVARYFLNFGGRTLLVSTLRQALDRVDDLWAGTFLGEAPLGFYSRAYTFATYPRKILSNPLNSVAGGTYAELKDQPKRLSQAFFRVNAFLVRTGFLVAGLLALVAPEFIRLVIGVKWLPMLTAFRLMIVFTMLDPIKVTVSSLFVAVGQPEKTARAHVIQLGVMVSGLFLLGLPFGIAGVALAVDLMLVVGIALLLWQARAYVRFSLFRLFTMPTVALVAGMTLARAAIMLPGVLGSPWRTGAVKGIVFLLIYIAVLLLMERDLLPLLIRMIHKMRPDRQVVAS